MAELKPCPFCGSKKVMIVEANSIKKYVACSELNCASIGPVSKNVSMAGLKWNTRKV